MSLFESTFDRIEKTAALKKAGKFTGIPYPFEKMQKYLPSIDKEQVIGLTSFSGAAKSKFTRYTYVLYPYHFSLTHDYPLLIDLYALEDSAQKIFKNIICHYLFMKKGIKISLFDLDSKFRELPSDTLRLIKEGETYLQDFSNKVRIKENIFNPYGIYLDVLKTAETLGEIHKKEIKFADGRTAEQIVGFTPKDDTHWMGICDNLNNLEKEKHHFNKKEAMDNFVSKDCRLVYSKIFKMTWVIVHQQALEAERQQFTNTGSAIAEKTRPSIANLGETKEVVRAYHLLLSLYNPHKFKIPTYSGYDIGKLGNNFRELEVLKYNDGANDYVRVPLYFDGAAEFFSELPHPKDQTQELENFYKWLDNERFKKTTNSLF